MRWGRTKDPRSDRNEMIYIMHRGWKRRKLKANAERSEGWIPHNMITQRNDCYEKLESKGKRKAMKTA